MAVCGTEGAVATGRLVDSLVRFDSTKRWPTAVLTMGDNAYPSGSEGVDRDFERCFATTWGTPRVLQVIHPSPGNHDYDSGSGQPYFAYFGDRAGPAGKGYYSFDFGTWHIVSLNSELLFKTGSEEEAKAQEDWLRKDLAAHHTLCTLAYWHRGLFSSGVYGATEEVRGLWDILYQNGVDLVLNGHEHHYERFAPQTPAGVADSATGIAEIIAGTGGGTLRRLRSEIAPNSAYRVKGRFGVLKLTLGDGQYVHSFIDADGGLWDPSGGKCH
ncbi:MAG: metallophosphoesterase family protein [Gemmatimonadaceae bacterium]